MEAKWRSKYRSSTAIVKSIKVKSTILRKDVFFFVKVPDDCVLILALSLKCLGITVGILGVVVLLLFLQFY